MSIEYYGLDNAIHLCDPGATPDPQFIFKDDGDAFFNKDLLVSGTLSVESIAAKTTETGYLVIDSNNKVFTQVGSAGAQGTQGSTGSQGATGSGAQGAQGIQGATGTGSQGTQGTTGDSFWTRTGGNISPTTSTDHLHIGTATYAGGRVMISDSDNTVYDSSQASHQR